jgi:protein TonB
MLLKQNLISADWLLIGDKFNGSGMRYCWALLSGFLITAGLFVLMHHLITGSETEIAPAAKGGVLTISPIIEDQDPTPKDPRPKPPPPVATEPLTKIDFPKLEGDFGNDPILEFAQPKRERETQIGIADGGLLPIVAVAPTYPRRMAARGIEGWVLLEFSVDPVGRVRNASVIEASPSSGFNKSALAAVTRYKYKPKVIGGKASWVHGVQTRITFNLEGQ